MSTNPRLLLLFLAAVILGLSTTDGCAQSAGLDETVGPDGVAPSLQLTPLQRSAVYNAVVQQRLRGSSRGIAAFIGAPVPPSAELRDLPDRAALGAAGGFLKYAMVADEVVVVDPIRMRVVDVIRNGAGP
jgi:hypothetical protein